MALHPGHAEALTQRGVILTEVGRPDDALVQYEQTLSADPNSILAHLNRGNALGALNRLEEANLSYDEVLTRDPEHADANFNQALVRLCLGDFLAGWPQYEYRWKRECYVNARAIYPRPIWTGKEDLRSKTILLCAEQGLGDAIQFSRYAAILSKLGAKVLIGAHRPLTEVSRDSPGRHAGHSSKGDELPHFDFIARCLSTAAGILHRAGHDPRQYPLYRTRQESALLPGVTSFRPNGRLRVGICWAGTGEHHNNRNRLSDDAGNGLLRFFQSWASILSACRRRSAPPRRPFVAAL